MRILVIDDDPILARTFQRALRDHMVAIETAPGRGIAHAVTAACEGAPFDAVVCDLNMPEMSGPQVFARLRADLPASVHLPLLVLMTGGDVEHTAAIEADAVMLKPFRPRELLDTITSFHDVV